MKYGDRIKEERERQGFTQDELAKAAGISSSYMGDIERGRKTPTIEVFRRIARALSRQVDHFFTDSSSWESQINADYVNMIERSGLDPRHRKALLGVIDMGLKESILEVYKKLRIAGLSDLKRKFYRDERRILIDGRIEREMEAELEIIGEEAQNYAHRYIQSYDYRGTGYKEFEVALVSSEIPGSEAKLKIGRTDENFVYYQVTFFPPLRKGQTAKLMLREKYRDAHIMTRDRLLDLMKEGRLMEERPVERTGSLMMYPTERLVKKIIFPEGYVLGSAFFDVAVNRVKQTEEKNRLMAADAFKWTTVENKQVCELVVDNALMGCNYLIFWEPPSEADYQKLIKGPKSTSSTK
jgi:transcriptional regulator with XRE-family HTH domain